MVIQKKVYRLQHRHDVELAETWQVRIHSVTYREVD